MSGGSRVSIPGNVLKTIHDIKEITGKHSDEDIYAMLRECCMDPNETTQKLLYLDTFHEVKKKRDRRKENLNSRASEDSRLTPGTQGRGARVGRGNYSSHYISHDAGGGRNMAARKENGANHNIGRGFVPSSLPDSKKTENNATPHVAKSLIVSDNGPMSISNGSSSHGCAPQLSAGSVINLPKGSLAVDVGKLESATPLPTVDVEHPPTPTSVSGTRVELGKSTSSFDHLLTCMTPALVSVVYSSASDPVLLTSLNSRHPGAVGTIKRDVGSQRLAAEPSATIMAESRSTTSHDLENHIQPASHNVDDSELSLSTSEKAAASGIVNSIHGKMPSKSQGVDKNKLSEPSQPSSASSHDHSLAIRSISNYDSRPQQQLTGPSKVVASEVATMTVVGSSQSPPELNVSVLEEATSELDLKLEKLNVSCGQHVIIPNHLQVPESFKNGLTFGSFDASLGQSIKYTNGPDADKCSTPVADSYQGNDETAMEPSPSNQTVSSTAQEGDYPDPSQSPPHVPENLPPLEGNVSYGAVPKYDQLKQEILLPPGGPQFPVVQTAPNYPFGFVPPMLGGRLVQFEGPEAQARDVSHIPNFVSGNSLVLPISGPTPPATQPAGVMQNSVAVSPQPVPVLRQPYPPNYFPYGPYYPFYLPPTIHQFLSHNGFPQQSSTGNVYLPPAAAMTGVKFSPPQYKPGTNSGNPTSIGIPSGYGSYGSPPVGYSPSPAVTSGSSTGNEDLAASQLKEHNIYTMGQQGEGSPVWIPTPGRDISGLQANSFYNLPPQGQHVTFSPAQAGHGPFTGIYHPAQTMAAPSTVHPLMQQSQAMTGSIEMVGAPSGAYLQPQHAQVNWNTNY